MEIKDGRYRGSIVGRQTRKSKDGNSEFIDIDLGTDQFFDPLTGQWDLVDDHALVIRASYFIRSQGEVNVPAVRAFAEAAGWDYSSEQFDADTWVPKKIQVRLKMKAKADGFKGHWFTFTDIAPFDAPGCGKGSTSLGDTMSEFRKITGDAQPAPYVPAPPPPPLTPGDEIPF